MQYTIPFSSQSVHIPVARAQSSRRRATCPNIIFQDHSETEFQLNDVNSTTATEERERLSP
jgi:hypothetical protein